MNGGGRTKSSDLDIVEHLLWNKEQMFCCHIDQTFGNIIYWGKLMETRSGQIFEFSTAPYTLGQLHFKCQMWERDITFGCEAFKMNG